jgi:hypothetical protein
MSKIVKLLKACEIFSQLVKSAQEQLELPFGEDLKYGDPGYWEYANDESINYDFDEWVNGYITITYTDLFKFFDRLEIKYKACGKTLQPAWGLVFNHDDEKYVLTFEGKVSNIEELRRSENECDSPTEAKSFVVGADEDDLDRYVGESTISEDFWESPSVLYHATSFDNKEDILEDGLIAKNDARAIINKSVGSAVFTSTNPDAIDAYGGLIFEIDTQAMKANGYTPEIGIEPDIIEGERKQSLAHMVGLEDYNYDYTDIGVDPDTIIVFGDIPSEYLKVYQE